MLDKVKEIALAIAAIGSLVLIFSVIGLIAMTIVVHYGSQLISYAFTGIEDLTWFQSFNNLFYFGINGQRSLKC